MSYLGNSAVQLHACICYSAKMFRFDDLSPYGKRQAYPLQATKRPFKPFQIPRIFGPQLPESFADNRRPELAILQRLAAAAQLAISEPLPEEIKLTSENGTRNTS